MAVAPSLHLLRSFGSSPCTPDHFGAQTSNASEAVQVMWVSNGCDGLFSCQGVPTACKDSRSTKGQHTLCTCSAACPQSAHPRGATNVLRIDGEHQQQTGMTANSMVLRAARLVAACLSGEQRTLAAAARHIERAMIAPIREMVDVFVAVRGLSTRMEHVVRTLFQPLALRNMSESSSWRGGEPSGGGHMLSSPSSYWELQTSGMATCMADVHESESVRGHRYAWLLRLRTDAVYSSSLPPLTLWPKWLPTDAKVVYVAEGMRLTGPMPLLTRRPFDTLITRTFFFRSRPAVHVSLSNALPESQACGRASLQPAWGRAGWSSKTASA